MNTPNETKPCTACQNQAVLGLWTTDLPNILLCLIPADAEPVHGAPILRTCEQARDGHCGREGMLIAKIAYSGRS